MQIQHLNEVLLYGSASRILNCCITAIASNNDYLLVYNLEIVSARIS